MKGYFQRADTEREMSEREIEDINVSEKFASVARKVHKRVQKYKRF